MIGDIAHSRLKTALAALAVLAAGSLLAVSPAGAEGDPSVQSWRIIVPTQRPATTRTAPARAPAQTYRARRRYDAPRPRYPDDSTLGLHMPEITVAMPAMPDSARTKIALVGDSLAEALAFGLEADPTLKTEFLLRQKTVSASGLVRTDVQDWPKAISALITEHPDPAALVVMVGLNDRQAIRAGEVALEPLSEPWREAYRKRIDAVISAAQIAKIPLVWVGMPIVRTPKLSVDLAVINEMVRDRVTASGETYVDIYDGFADQSGGFTATGPDVIGDIVRLRGPDGIHFTPAGQRKLAFFVEKPLRKRIGERLPSQDSSTQPVPLSASLPSPGTEIAIPVPAPAALTLPIARPRVDIGEIRSLATSGSASTLTARQPKPLEDPATRDLFDRGLSPGPRAGRSDDYRWR